MSKKKEKFRFLEPQKSSAKKENQAKQASPKFSGVLIRPSDPVFFRDGKPFTMGEEVHTTGIFPPLPSVLQGALRSVYFASHPDEIPVKETQDDKTAGVAFANALLCHNRTLLFPWPADLLLVGGGIISLKPAKREKRKFMSSQGNDFSYFLEKNEPSQAKVDSTAHHYLTTEGMNNYLNGKTPPEKDCLNLKKLGWLHEESRIGIGRNAYGVTEEGQLYRMTRLRMHDELLLYVAHSGLKIPPKGSLALGSEGVSATYATTSLPLLLPGCALGFDRNAIYKLYIVSPAVVESDRPYLPPCLRAVGVKVLTFATDRPVSVGGWDMKANAPKPMKSAIPAGSVYFFTVADAPAFEKVKALHGHSVCEGEYAQQGFGIVLLGIHRL